MSDRSLAPEGRTWRCPHRPERPELGDPVEFGAFVVPPPASSRPVPAAGTALDGLVIPIKDNIDVAGWPTRAGSAATSSAPATTDATVVSRLRAAGALPGGKTSMDEFAFTTYGRGMRNPLDPSLIVGGSSGGSALTVALGAHCAAIGTDTGGSVRIPAAYCGVVGFKPTYGAISTQGVIPLSWTLDHVGVIGCCVDVVTAVFGACREDDAPRARPRAGTNLRVAVPQPGYLEAATRPARAAMETAVEALVRLGARIEVVSLPDIRQTLDEIHYPLAVAEAATYHASTFTTFDNHGPEAREIIETGLRMTAPQYIGARRDLCGLRAEVGATLAGFDVLVLPTTPTNALRQDADVVELGDGQLVNRLDASVWFTALFNDLGAPAISLPVRVGHDTMGVQLAAPAGADDALLSVASTLERELPRH